MTTQATKTNGDLDFEKIGRALGLLLEGGNDEPDTNFQIKFDEDATALKYRLGGTVFTVATAGGGLTEEQVEDIVGAMFPDNSDLDWTYDDNGDAVGATIKDNTVTNARLADMPTARLLGRVTAATGDPEYLTAAQAKGLLAIVAADISDFVANVRSSISVTDSAQIDFTYAAGDITGTIKDGSITNAMLATDYATQAELDAAIASLIDSAPGLLDTLNELAAALGDDPNFATTITNLINARAKHFAGLVGDGVATDIPVTHSLGTQDVLVGIRLAAGTKRAEWVPWVITDNDTITLNFPTGAPPATNEYRVVVIGK